VHQNPQAATAKGCVVCADDDDALPPPPRSQREGSEKQRLTCDAALMRGLKSDMDCSAVLCLLGALPNFT